MKPTDWAYRAVCEKCRDAGEPCLSDDQFWARGPCPKCGSKRRVVLCRAVEVRYREFLWWNPRTWFAFGWLIEFGK